MRSIANRHAVVFPAAVLGIGLSGLFDGILLHQVLQWHHLLSLVPGEPFNDIRMQIFADGLFHFFMYFITGLGLWMLLRRRSALALPSAGWRQIAGGSLLGFGLWNVIDVGFFHWILGIHRIRINVPEPLLYDLTWIVLLGGVPLAIGWIPVRGKDAGHSAAGVATALALLAVAASMLAARPQPNLETAVVLFPPGTSQASLFHAAIAAETPVIRVDPRGMMMAVSAARPKADLILYRNGALFVTRSPALAGCAATLGA